MGIGAIYVFFLIITLIMAFFFKLRWKSILLHLSLGASDLKTLTNQIQIKWISRTILRNYCLLRYRKFIRVEFIYRLSRKELIKIKLHICDHSMLYCFKGYIAWKSNFFPLNGISFWVSLVSGNKKIKRCLILI